MGADGFFLLPRLRWRLGFVPPSSVGAGSATSAAPGCAAKARPVNGSRCVTVAVAAADWASAGAGAGGSLAETPALCLALAPIGLASPGRCLASSFAWRLASRLASRLAPWCVRTSAPSPRCSSLRPASNPASLSSFGSIRKLSSADAFARFARLAGRCSPGLAEPSAQLGCSTAAGGELRRRRCSLRCVYTAAAQVASAMLRPLATCRVERRAAPRRRASCPGAWGCSGPMLRGLAAP